MIFFTNKPKTMLALLIQGKHTMAFHPIDYAMI